MKNLESYFYRDHEIVMDGKTPKFKKVDDEELNESRELMTH
jgi:tetrahydromethanopterin S-methyltransferase subunit H